MGECCALLICKLHLVLKAQWFLWPFCPEVAVEDDFLEKGGEILPTKQHFSGSSVLF